MTPLAILDAIGVEPPRFPPLPYLPKSMETLEDVEVVLVLKEAIQDDLRKVPELEPEKLRLGAPVSTGELPVWAG